MLGIVNIVGFGLLGVEFEISWPGMLPFTCLTVVLLTLVILVLVVLEWVWRVGTVWYTGFSCFCGTTICGFCWPARMFWFEFDAESGAVDFRANCLGFGCVASWSIWFCDSLAYENWKKLKSKFNFHFNLSSEILLFIDEFDPDFWLCVWDWMFWVLVVDSTKYSSSTLGFFVTRSDLRLDALSLVSKSLSSLWGFKCFFG